MAHVSVKSHDNGAKNPKAHLRNRIDEDRVLNAPMVAEPLGLFDCCGVSDGAACAIVTAPEIARSLGKMDLVTVKALQLSVSNGTEAQHNSWDGSYFMTTRKASERAYKEAGITNPREELSLIEVHDCFSITELITMEDLHISHEGGAVADVMDGFYDADGPLPCQIDGGLKCFGHPIGASGLRMIYEIYLQMLGRAGGAPARGGAGAGTDPQPRRVPAPERLLGGDRGAGGGLKSPRLHCSTNRCAPSSATWRGATARWTLSGVPICRRMSASVSGQAAGSMSAIGGMTHSPERRSGDDGAVEQTPVAACIEHRGRTDRVGERSRIETPAGATGHPLSSARTALARRSRS